MINVSDSDSVTFQAQQ